MVRDTLITWINGFCRNPVTNHLFDEKQNRAVRDLMLKCLGLYRNPSKWVSLE